jgi:HEAT repeat protein
MCFGCGLRKNLRPFASGLLSAALLLGASLPAMAVGTSEGRARLETALHEESFKVRAAAAVALGRMGDDEAVVALSKAIERDDHYAVRAAAAGAIGRIGASRGVAALLYALTDENAFVREEAREALERFHKAEHLVAFEPALDAAAPARRLAAVQAYGAVLREGHDEAAAPLLTALGDADEGVRLTAQGALDRIPHERAVPVLIAGLSHDDADSRTRCADMLSRRADERAVAPLLGALSSLGERDEVRGAIRHALKNHRAYISIERTRANARSSAVVDDRASALRLLAALEDAEALPLLELAIGDPSPVIRTAAARALVDIGGPSAKGVLTRAAQSETDVRVKRQLELGIKQIR